MYNIDYKSKSIKYGGGKLIIHLKSKGGYLLLYILFIVALAGVITPVLLQTTFQAYKNVVRSGDDAQALSLAEGALEIGYRVLLSRYQEDNYFEYNETKFRELLSTSRKTVEIESSSLSKGSMELEPTLTNAMSQTGQYIVELTGLGKVGAEERTVKAKVELAPMSFSGGAPLIIHEDALGTFNRLKNEQLLTVSYAPHVSPKEPNLISGSELSSFRPEPGSVVQITEDGLIIDQSIGENKAYITQRLIRAETIKIRVHQSKTYVIDQFLICDHIEFSQDNNSPLAKTNYINNGLLVFKSFNNIENPFKLRRQDNKGVAPLDIYVSSNNKSLNNLEGYISDFVPRY